MMAEAIPFNGTSTWWDEVNNSTVWQDRIFHTLAGLYGLLSVVFLIQLARIHNRVPEYGWTTQKLFHLLNFLVNGVRCIVLALRRNVQQISPEVFQHVLLDFPGLLFFTTYAILVLFWTEIYYQARSLPTHGLRPTFYIINTTVYLIQISLWLLFWWKPTELVLVILKLLLAGVPLLVSLGFLLYGGRLFLLVYGFRAKSRGREKKLFEVGSVTIICITSSLVRCIMMYYSAFDLDALNHPSLNFIFCMLVEILPSASVLYILRILPPRRINTTHHAAD